MMGVVIDVTHLTLGTPTCIVCGSPFERRAVYWECVGCGNRIRHNRTTPDDVAWFWSQVAQAAIIARQQRTVVTVARLRWVDLPWFWAQVAQFAAVQVAREAGWPWARWVYEMELAEDVEEE